MRRGPAVAAACLALAAGCEGGDRAAPDPDDVPLTIVTIAVPQVDLYDPEQDISDERRLVCLVGDLAVFSSLGGELSSITAGGSATATLPAPPDGARDVACRATAYGSVVAAESDDGFRAWLADGSSWGQTPVAEDSSGAPGAWGLSELGAVWVDVGQGQEVSEFLLDGSGLPVQTYFVPPPFPEYGMSEIEGGDDYVAGISSERIDLWRATSGEHLTRVECGCRHADVITTGSMVATAYADGDRVLLRELHPGDAQVTLALPDDMDSSEVRGIAVGPGSTFVAAGTADGRLLVWTSQGSVARQVAPSTVTVVPNQDPRSAYVAVSGSDEVGGGESWSFVRIPTEAGSMLGPPSTTD